MAGEEEGVGREEPEDPLAQPRVVRVTVVGRVRVRDSLERELPRGIGGVAAPLRGVSDHADCAVEELPDELLHLPCERHITMR